MADFTEEEWYAEALQECVVSQGNNLRLKNVIERARDGETLTLAMVGGSITEGALASDYNPGSSPSGDMRFIWALGCIRMRLTPNQAFNAVTLNSAYAMGVSDQCGSITVGKRADLILTRPGWNLTKIPYLHHSPFIRQVYLQGKAV